MNLGLMMKKQQFIKLLDKCAKSNAPISELDEVYIAYRQFCFNNRLNDDINYHDYVGDKLIIPVTYNNKYIDNNEIALAADKLVESYKANLKFGITYEEADVILKWIVQNARQAVLSSGENQTTTYMHTCDYFVQTITALPFIDKGIHVTINDSKKFNGSLSSHGFITVDLPIQENEKVVLKKFLIDVFYSQFFTYEKASFGLFYGTNSNPAAGFYVCQTPEGISFATDLIRDGYIELTIDNARIYGAGFECEKLDITNYNNWKEIMKKPGEYYLDIIENNQGSLVHNSDSLELYDVDIKFPTLSKKKKYE